MYNACQDGDVSALAEDLCGRLAEMNDLNIFSVTEKNNSNLCWTLLEIISAFRCVFTGAARSRDHGMETASDAFVSIFNANDYCGLTCTFFFFNWH